MNYPRALIFDLDGTLYSRRGLAFRLLVRQWRNIFRMQSLKKIRKEIAGIDFGSGALLLEKVNTACGSKDWYTHSFYPDFIRTLQGRRARSGLIELLKLAKSRGVRTALLSDHAFNKERLLALHIDPQLFDALISCEEIGALKPHPRGFLTAAQLLNVPVSDCLMVGDRIDTDAAGAENCSMKSFIISAAAYGGEEKGWQLFAEKFTGGTL